MEGATRETGEGPEGRAGWAESLHETVPVEPGGTLWVDLDVGSVDVESHDADAVEVDAAARGGEPGVVEFRLERSGNDVVVEADVDHWLRKVIFGVRVRVRARVPRRYSVDVRTRGGAVRLRAIGGRVAAETKGGSIHLDDAAGPALCRTAGGSIEVRRVDGDLRARTLGGHIEVEHVNGDVEARTGGGHVEVSEASGRVEATTTGGHVSASFTGAPAGTLETSGGSIEVRFPRGQGANLDASTSGGRVRVDHAVEVTGKLSPSHVTGQIAGGGAPLHLRTSGGSIRVRES